MAVTFTAFLLTSCGGITGTFEDQTNDTSPTVTETRNVNFTADSNGLFSFPTKSNSRTILPGEVETVPPKVNLDKFIKANKVVKMTGVVIDFSSIPVA